jgi:hypothetical protein
MRSKKKNEYGAATDGAIAVRQPHIPLPKTRKRKRDSIEIKKSEQLNTAHLTDDKIESEVGSTRVLLKELAGTYQARTGKAFIPKKRIAKKGKTGPKNKPNQ